VDQRGDIVDADEPLTKSPHLQLDHVHLLEPELMNRIWATSTVAFPKCPGPGGLDAGWAVRDLHA
jgi:hypothetical protein